MLGFERALVSDIPGTTRDLIESEVFYNNSSFRVLDSAGIRETDDVIEGKGIELTVSQIESADVVVGVFDSVDPVALLEIKSLVVDRVFISVLNKLDLGLKDEGSLFDVLLSAKTGEGVVELKKLISSSSVIKGLVDKEYFARSRHIKLFNEGLVCLEAAVVKLRSGAVSYTHLTLPTNREV